MGDADWSRVALLADPARCAIYEALAGDVELTREELAERIGISPGLATHHLAKLTAAGVLEKQPGVAVGREGRPPAHYRRGPAVQLPGRRPELLADLLTAGRPDMQLVKAAARSHGRGITPPAGVPRTRARRAMELLGFAPQSTRRTLDSGNCPFVARELASPESACDVALSLAAGIADEVSDVQVERVVGGACCVRLRLPGKQAG